ncbi:MAG: transglutaminase domain-containing protein, partial [Lachnospiraceae bacterium]|nr:transglutaminase domain-containing protein [Lachnospiraceae bacterium]
ISLVFLITFYPIAHGSVGAQSAINKVKKSSDEYVKTFVRSGLAGFFNRYESSGGLSTGRLGGVSSIRPDFQPDLRITYTPYDYETVYLRAFVGVDYTGNSWKDSQEAQTNIPTLYKTDGKTDDYVEFTTFLETARLEKYLKDGGRFALKGRMDIVNLDADPGYSYTPYYTSRSGLHGYTNHNHVLNNRAPLNVKQTYEYYPAVREIDNIVFPPYDSYESSLSLDSDTLSYLSAYKDYCYETYTYVPDNLKEPIGRILDKIGHGTGIQDQIDLVNNYFTDAYTYSMSPGATPYREDFIEYFLTRQDQGYCAHFASAATMIFRYMGIPARYVEGYVISAASIEQGERLDIPYSEYMTGDSPIGETAVIQVDVTDANAHAWVEVYSDGFGWVLVDPTPPSDDTDDYSDFWDVFAGLFSVSGQQGGQGNATGQNIALPDGTWENFLASTNHLSYPFLLLLLLMILFYPLTRLARNLYAYIRQRIAFLKGDYAKTAVYYYRRLIFCLLRRGMLRTSDSQKHHNMTYWEKMQFYHTFAPQKLLDADLGEYALDEDYILLLEKALYSHEGITQRDILRFKARTLQLIKPKNGRHSS